MPVQPEHVCILFRRFTNFGTDLTQEYVRALEARGIAHLLVGSKSFHRREEVGTLRTALRAIEWPDDELSVFAVLRGSLCAVPDDTLLSFKQRARAVPSDAGAAGGSGPGVRADSRRVRRCCASCIGRRNYRPIADTIHELLEATRAHAGFAFRKGGERVLANVYRLTDLARSFEVAARRDLVSRVRRISGRRVRRQRHERGAGAGAGRRRRAVDDGTQGEGAGVPGGDPGRPDGEADGAAGRRPALRSRSGGCARSGCSGARRGNCWTRRRTRRRRTRKRRCGWRMWRRRGRGICWWWRRWARRSAQGGWLSPLHEALYPPKERWRVAARGARAVRQFGATQRVEPAARSRRRRCR